MMMMMMIIIMMTSNETEDKIKEEKLHCVAFVLTIEYVNSMSVQRGNLLVKTRDYIIGYAYIVIVITVSAADAEHTKPIIDLSSSLTCMHIQRS
jgi:hypothetical protein